MSYRFPLRGASEKGSPIIMLSALRDLIKPIRKTKLEFKPNLCDSFFLNVEKLHICSCIIGLYLNKVT